MARNLVTRPWATGMAMVLVLVGMTLGPIPQAFAKSPIAKLKGDIIISTKRFPSRFDSDAKMAKHMRKVNTHEVFASGDSDWEFEYMAFLGEPIATLQAAVTFYDITVPGSQKLVDTFSFSTSQRKEKIINGHSRLSASKFKPDRKYLMVFSRGYGQKALAQTKVVLRRK